MGSKAPTLQSLLAKKTTADSPPREPVWVYLEREMKENEKNKPYNEKVGEWLRFMKDLKQHYRDEAKAQKNRLVKDVGPPWYTELSKFQRHILEQLKMCLHQDIIEDIPKRTNKALIDLGMTLKIPKSTIMLAMKESSEDPGVFMWNLYKNLYKLPPSEPCKSYDINGMILMSSLVFIDLDECIQYLEKLTTKPKPPPPPPKKKPKQNTQPDEPLGEYLQKIYVPLVSTHRSPERGKPRKLSLEYKLKLKSETSFERLRNDHSFLAKRKNRNKREKEAERVCTYKFWEPPCELRSSDPHVIEIARKEKAMKKKAKPKHQAPYKNVQFQVGGIAFGGKKPYFVIQGVVILPSGFIPIHGGEVKMENAHISNVIGFWRYPNDVSPTCDDTCDCVAKWGRTVMDYKHKSKCKCGHYYDFFNEGKVDEIFFRPPTKYGPLEFDEAQIFQMDPTENFIKDTVREALKSRDPTPVPSTPILSTSNIAPEILLKGFMADLADSPLIIPHLPEANNLNNLKEYVRRRIHGDLTPKEHKKLKLQTLRRWNDLDHINFKPRTPRIPFTQKELKYITWKNRHMIQKLSTILREDFITRNRKKQLEQARLFWATLKNDTYPSMSFLDIYYTYMPGRMKDVLMLNPYSADLVAKNVAKTCPLNF